MKLRWEMHVSNANLYWCFDLAGALHLGATPRELPSAVQHLGTPLFAPTCLVAVLKKSCNATNASTTVRTYVKRLGGDPALVRQGRPPYSLDVLQWGFDELHGEAMEGFRKEYDARMMEALAEGLPLRDRRERLEVLKREVEAAWMPVSRSALFEWHGGEGPDVMVAYKKTHLTYQRRLEYVRLKSGEELPSWRTFELHYRSVSLFNGCATRDKNYLAGAKEAYRLCSGRDAADPRGDADESADWCETCNCAIVETRRDGRLLESSKARLRELKTLRKMLICRSYEELYATLCCENARRHSVRECCQRCLALLRGFDERKRPGDYLAAEQRVAELTREPIEVGEMVERTCRCGTVKTETATSRRRVQDEEGICARCRQPWFKTTEGRGPEASEPGCTWLACGCGRRAVGPLEGLGRRL